LSNSVKDSPTKSNKVTQGEKDTDREEEVQKPSRVKRESDPRHTAFKEAIRKYWDSKNAGVDMPWGPAEGKQLGMWLREAPHITLEQFTLFLRNRYKSQVNHGERPCQWIKWVTSYGPGPVDKYKNTAGQTEAGNGKVERSAAAAASVVDYFENRARIDGGQLLSGSGDDGELPETVRGKTLEGKS
jgi:hypothetical protein